MITWNEPSYPEDDSYSGLTKREQFAMSANVTDEMVELDRIIIEALIGRSIDSDNAFDIINGHIECEAKLKVMKADALITELNKEKP